MCAVWDSGLHGKGQRVKAPSECSKWVVNSVSLSRDLPVFPGFFEIIRVFIYKNKTINKNILFNIDKQIRNPNVEIITIPGNLDTKDWGIKAAHYMVDELKERGAIGDEIQY